MRLIDWEHMRREVSRPGVDPRNTYNLAKQQGLEDLDARLASVIMNCQGDELYYTLLTMARDPTVSVMEDETDLNKIAAYQQALMPRALAFMELSRVIQTRGNLNDPERLEHNRQEAKRFRAEALAVAREIQQGYERQMIVAWIESAQMMMGDVTPDWTMFRANLSWLITHHARDAAEFGRFYAEEALKRQDFVAVREIVDDLTVQFTKGLVHTKEDVRALTTLDQERRRLQAEARANKPPPRRRRKKTKK